MLEKQKIKIAQVVHQLSIGGTEKTIEVFANNLNKDIFEVSIFALISGGPRYLNLKNKFKVHIINKDYDLFSKLLKENRIDIMHIHRAGSAEPLPIEAGIRAGVPLIVETKVFGAIDNSSSGKNIDASIFVSKMCAIRYMKKRHLFVEEFIKNNSVIYNPIEIDKHTFLPEEVSAFKDKLGIKSTDFVVGRISRADPFKFGNVCLTMMPYLLQEIPNVKYIIVGCPTSKLKIINKLKLNDNIILLPELLNEKEVSLFYKTIDLFAYAAYHGESFGITIAEAMANNKPVIVNSTPSIDNAQIELVDHGQNGFIANNSFNYAKAVAYLLKNKPLRGAMGKNGYQKVKSLYEAKTVTKQLEKLYLDLCDNKGLRVPHEAVTSYKRHGLSPNAKELNDFISEYAIRKTKQFDQFSLSDKIIALFKKIFIKGKPLPVSPQKLSIILIVQNEELMLGQWFKQICLLNPFEVVVVDSNSTDNTMNIIKSYSNKLNLIIKTRPLGGSFAEQRNFAKHYCTGDWLLALDADETLTENSITDINNLLYNESVIAYSFPRIVLFPDDKHFIGKPNGDLQLRLFRNLPEIEYIYKVHEYPAYKNKPLFPGIISTKKGWKWCWVKKNIKIIHWAYIKPMEKLIEREKRWQGFRAASKERGINIDNKDAFILDPKKVLSKPIGQLK